MSLRKLLIANRGEIAVRIARTARAMGLDTVAVASEADRSAPHLEAADEAVLLGPADPAESYLSIPRLLEAAERTGADAVHPGYGFLAEEAAFARAVIDSGRVFVGPDPEVIELMGRKDAAKRRAAEIGLPILPGGQAEEVGYPLLVKAAAGGGGRGLRRVDHPDELEAALGAARREAEAAFGAGELLLEPWVGGARHVEVQVFGDRGGRVIHLGERECSIQRRHQKLIEESPSPALTEELRSTMTRAALELARAVGYVGAGTVEFLLAPDHRFFFLEMNTRLQVEHPVTEAVTGLDLVEWQLRIAAGEPLPLHQDEVDFRGWAIEARVCAEDPAADFAPQSGRLKRFRPPELAGVRADHALADGVEVSPAYDSLLAKVIAWGRDREGARRRLVRALGSMTASGLATNRAFLVRMLEHPVFAAGEATTEFIDRHLGAAEREAVEPGPVALALAAVHVFEAGACEGPALWCFRNAGEAAWPIALAWPGGRVEARVEAPRPGTYRVVLETGERLEVEGLERRRGRSRAWVDGVLEEARAEFLDDPALELEHRGGRWLFHEPSRNPGAAHRGAGGGRLTAPISGRVIAVEARIGDEVEAGRCLLTLEAMKLEHRVKAAVDGRVDEIHVEAGDQVTPGQLLLLLSPRPAVSPEGHP